MTTDFTASDVAEWAGKLIAEHPYWENPISADGVCLYVGKDHGCIASEIFQRHLGVTAEELKSHENTSAQEVAEALELPLTHEAGYLLGKLQQAADGRVGYPRPWGKITIKNDGEIYWCPIKDDGDDE